MTSSFDLLSTSIRHSLWQMQWYSLHPIQEQCIVDILTTPNDLLISAPTASGKTEAAFLPILSRISESSGGSIQAIYVSPLKALINSQFERLSELCRISEIAVHRWHGDVAHRKKVQTIKKPTGVLLITPESLESLFVNRSDMLARLFCDLEFIVIDEIHAMLGTERGLQLQSLVLRLERYTKHRLRRVALSASIGDLRSTAEWMCLESPDSVHCRTAENPDRNVRLQVRCYLVSPDRAYEDGLNATSNEMDRDLFDLYWGRKCLLFTNSRATAELLTDRLNDLARAHGRDETFLIHHGSLSADTRTHTESRMQGDGCWQVVCSSTLELGIDVGDIETTAQIGPCQSPSSMLQRMGRSGRRGAQPEMRVFVPCHEPEPHKFDDGFLYPPLLQTIAVTELLLEGRHDKPALTLNDYSTLIQQLLSSIVEFGGITAEMLYSSLCGRGAFRNRQGPLLSEQEFMDLLRHIHLAGLIEQLEGGVLVLGPTGEREVGHRQFYAAFSSESEFTVMWESTKVGMISSSRLPGHGSGLILAGKRWRVKDVDMQRRAVTVSPYATGQVPHFSGGYSVVSTEIRRRMHAILFSESMREFLDASAVQMLDGARSLAKRMSLDRTSVVAQAGLPLRWFPWVGSHGLFTIRMILQVHGIDAKPSFHQLSLSADCSIDELRRTAEKVISQPVSIESLVSQIENFEVRKWDHFVPKTFLQRSFVNDSLNPIEAVNCFQLLLNNDSLSAGSSK